MSLVPYWLRHLRNLAHRDPVMRALEEPFAVFARDPFFRDPLRYLKQATALEPQCSAEGALAETGLKADARKVELQLDVRGFAPDQLSVKTEGDEVTVQGAREERRGGGWTRALFERRFVLPEGFPPERVECHLDGDTLRLVAFRAQPLPERDVPIQRSAATDKDAADKDAADKNAADKNSAEKDAANRAAAKDNTY